MFAKKLSAAIAQLCKERNWSLEEAAERCDLNPDIFCNIANGHMLPAPILPEKLCRVFRLLPQELLPASVVCRELAFRIPMKVTKRRGFIECLFGFTAYPICPQCGLSLAREYQCFCDRCGQQLCWNRYSKAETVLSFKE
ncbi:MAG: helix-turn-helix transcriptional regulator [Oscillospiraceae bacterium]|nr:helix-turn-helix transcriptional regulator [Oscillospiraceae bacterium]